MQRPEQQALLSQTQSALCSLCQIYREASAWNNGQLGRALLGSQEDIAFRIHLFKELASWNAQLHLRLRTGARAMAHTFYLKLVLFLLQRRAFCHVLVPSPWLP
jgi:hypothetical protein